MYNRSLYPHAPVTLFLLEEEVGFFGNAALLDRSDVADLEISQYEA